MFTKDERECVRKHENNVTVDGNGGGAIYDVQSGKLEAEAEVIAQLVGWFGQG